MRHIPAHQGTSGHFQAQINIDMSSNVRVQRVCQQCGKEFTAKTTVTQYCGDPCAKKAYKARGRAAKIEASNKETQRVRDRPVEDLKAQMFLSVADTCTLAGVSRRTIYRMIQRGALEVGKAGRRTIISRAALDRALVSHVSA